MKQSPLPGKIHSQVSTIIATVLAAFATLLATPGNAASFTSIQSGDWNAPATWGTATTVPLAGDTATITSGTTVTAVAAMNASVVTIDSGGTLDPSNGSSLGLLTNNGTLTPAANATVAVTNWTDNGTFVANGSTIVFNPNAATYTLSIAETFFNLTIASGASVNAVSLTVNGTLTLNGSLTFTSLGTNQFANVIAGASSSWVPAGAGISVSGNFTALGSSAPFTPNPTSSDTITFNGTTLQTISGNPFLPKIAVGTGGATTVIGTVRTNGATVNASALFEPDNGSEIGSISGPVTPVANATITVATQWSNVTFTPNNGTVIFGPTSWGLVPLSGLQVSSSSGTPTFTNLTVANNVALNPQGGFNVTGTFTLNGSVNTTSQTFQVNNFVCGSASSIAGGNSLQISGNFTTSNTAAPFGAPSSSNNSQVTFNGTGLQTIAGGPFIPNLNVGDATHAPTVTGKVLSNAVVVTANSLFEPGDGSEIGSIGGSMSPMPNATITVATAWSNVAFTANNGTVVFGPTSWGLVPLSGLQVSSSSGTPTFTNLTVANNVALNPQGGFNVTGTFTLNGSVNTTSQTFQVNNFVCGSASSIAGGNSLQISGNFTTSNTAAPFGAPSAINRPGITFNGTAVQTISGSPYLGDLTVGDSTHASTVIGKVLANSVTVSSNSLFEPRDGSEIGSISGPVTPVANATITVATQWSNVTFTPNNSTAVFGPTSWGLVPPPAIGFQVSSLSGNPTFANLTIADNYVVVPGVGFNVLGTFTLNGSLNTTSKSFQFNNFVCGSASSIAGGNSLQISGNYTTANSAVPFGAPSPINDPAITFNGTLTQTISGSPFIGIINVGDGTSASTVMGKVLSNGVTVAANSLFEPGDGSQFGYLTTNGTGAITPAAGATITVGGITTSDWNAGNFSANGGTVIFAPVPWAGSGGPSSTLSVSTTFANLVIGPGHPLNAIDQTVTVLNNFTAGDALNTVPATGGTGTLVFAGTALQSVSGAGTISVNTLTINNAQGVSSSTNTIVDTTINLNGGIYTTTVLLVLSGGVNQTTGWVSGPMRYMFPVNTTTAFTYPIGGATRSSPATVTAAPTVAGAAVDVSVSEGSFSPSLGANALRRSWTVTAANISSADLSFTYNSPADVPATEANLQLAEFSGGAWSFLGTLPNVTSHTVSQAGVTSFGTFSLGEPGSTLTFGAINNGANPRAGAPFPVVVNVVDANGGAAIVTPPTTIQLSLAPPPNAGTGTLGGTLTGTIPANGSTITLSGVTYSTGSTPVKLVASSTSGATLTSALSGPITILSAPASHFGIVAGASTSSAPFTVTITALDPNNSVDALYRGTIQFTSSDGSATLPGNYTFQPSDNGVHTFTLTLVTAGPQTVTVADVTTPTVNGSTSISVAKASTNTALTSGPNPSIFGQSVTLHATVSVVSPATANPVGSVTFLDGTTPLGTVTLTAGSASLSLTTLSAGTHSLNATYNGTANFNTSASSASQTVNRSNTATSVVTSVNPSVFGQGVTFTITVTPTGVGGGIPDGTVSLAEGATTLGGGTLNAAGVATILLNGLTVGTHSLTSVYSGSANYNGSSGAPPSQIVNSASTTTAVSTSVATSTLGQQVTFTATINVISPGAGIPTGSVQFFDGVTPMGSAAVNGSSQASFSTTSLAVGSHTINATYAGNGNFATSSGSVGQTVNPATPSVNFTSSANPSAVGQSITLTAIVSAPAGAPSPTGNVTFKDGTTTLAPPVALASGAASFTTSALALGSHSISAVYGGDGNFNAVTTPLTPPQIVNQTATRVMLTSSPNPSTFGQSVTFTATVTSSTGVMPTGSVTFSEGATTLGSGTLANGVASFSTSALTAGSHSITASYGGDTNNSAGSGSATQTVNQSATSTTILSSGSSSSFGQSVIFTILVSPNPAGSGTPTGSVVVSEGTLTLATVPLTGGQATYSTTALGTGNHTISALYGGDTSFIGSGGSVAQIVNQATPTVGASSSNSSTSFGQPVTFTAIVSSIAGSPTGSVTFSDNGSGVATVGLTGGTATFTTSTLTPGSHTILASYSGDTNFVSGSASVSQSVSRAPTILALVSNANPASFAQSVTFMATITAPASPAGSIVFADGTTTLATVAVSAGSASYSTSALTIGGHPITATYSGDVNLLGSSASLSETVKPASTTMQLTSSPNPSLYGNSVNFVATVVSAGGTPTGTVTFSDGTTMLGSATLAAGSASLAVSTLTIGTRAITAAYSGSTLFAASTSGTLNQTVNASPTSVSLVSSQNPSIPGQTVTFTARVSATSGGIPPGSVSFTDGTTVLATVSLMSGAATFSSSTLAVGTHSITAGYAGAIGFTASTSSVVTQTVNIVSSVSSISPSSTCQASGALTLTVHGTGFDPTLVVRWNGSQRPTTFVNATTLTAAITALDTELPGTFSVVVYDSLGNAIASSQSFGVTADTTPPLVIPPPALTILQTTHVGGIAGATGLTSGALATFIAGGIGNDACSASVRLSAQVGGIDVTDSTLFLAGTTNVMFRFIDGAGNIGTATSTVTVRVAGDANGDGTIDATDFVILKNALVGNLQLNAMSAAALDLNGDGQVDAVDLTLLANYLVGNVTTLGK